MTDQANHDLDDLTIDGTDLLLQLAAARDVPADGDDRKDDGDDERTVTEPRPAGDRWTPPVLAPAGSPRPARLAGFTRLQVGVIVGTFALGAVVGLLVGLSRENNTDPGPATIEATE